MTWWSFWYAEALRKQAGLPPSPEAVAEVASWKLEYPPDILNRMQQRWFWRDSRKWFLRTVTE